MMDISGTSANRHRIVRLLGNDVWKKPAREITQQQRVTARRGAGRGIAIHARLHTIKWFIADQSYSQSLLRI